MKASEMLHILKVQNKRLFIIWIITFIAFISLLGYTIYLLNDIGTIETTEVKQDNDKGYNNYIGNDGDITAIIDGIIYDTFDPSNRIMRCAWKID